MGVITYDMEIASSVPPAKMFKAFILDSDKLVPNVQPRVIKSVETLEGHGGPRTIKLNASGEG